MKKLQLDYQQTAFLIQIPKTAAKLALIMGLGGAGLEAGAKFVQPFADHHKAYVASAEHAEKLREKRIDECTDSATLIKTKDYKTATVNFHLVCTLAGATATNTAQSATSLLPSSNLGASFDKDFITEEVRIRNAKINSRADFMVQAAHTATTVGNLSKVYSPVAAAVVPLSPISYGIGVLATIAITGAAGAAARRRNDEAFPQPQAA